MFAFRAYEIDAFLEDSDDDNQFLASRLMCKDCNKFWETSLLECFFCNEINYYTKFCKVCKNKTTLTTVSTECPECQTSNPWIPNCVNESCISNTNQEIKNFVQGKITSGKHEIGVFGAASGWNTSNSFCLACGSSKSHYVTHTVSLYECTAQTFQKNELDKFSTDVVILADPSNSNFDIFKPQSDDSSSFSPTFRQTLHEIVKKLFS
tara:strand:+ start:807 stop:1430 length:624 start_codon:yes stop_codon:yes gene_type:complete